MQTLAVSEAADGDHRHAHRGLPRLINPDFLWVGGCLDIDYKGEAVHSHFGAFVVRGTEKSLMIDTGHPFHRPEIERALDEFLGGQPLDYILPTHPELPHCGLLPTWVRKFPDVQVVGDIGDYHLLYPELGDRFRQVELGQTIDLGGRRIMVVPSIWGDMANTRWAFDTKDAILFVSDAYAAIHHHNPGECGLMTSERPLPGIDLVRMLSKLTLQWSAFFDITKTFPQMDLLLDVLQPKMIAPAHGTVIDRPEVMTAMVKEAVSTAEFPAGLLNKAAVKP
jgi:flavorubredoxin